jgi:hypothetical protein
MEGYEKDRRRALRRWNREKKIALRRRRMIEYFCEGGWFGNHIRTDPRFRGSLAKSPFGGIRGHYSDYPPRKWGKSREAIPIEERRVFQPEECRQTKRGKHPILTSRRIQCRCGYLHRIRLIPTNRFCRSRFSIFEIWGPLCPDCERRQRQR